MSYRMIVDTNRCVGCHACSVACKQEFHAPLGHFRQMTMYRDVGTFPKVKREFLPISCRHCKHPDCMVACKNKAIYKVDGTVQIDESRCDGCGHCITACSIGAVYINPHTQKAEKCTLCLHRLKVGQQPACASTCVADAITIIQDGEPIPSDAHGIKNRASDTPSSLHIGVSQAMIDKLQDGKPFDPHLYEIDQWGEV